MTKKTTIICSSNDYEKVYALLNVTGGAASFAMDVTIFFTFWGLEVIKKSGLENLSLSKGDFPLESLKNRMNDNNITSLEELFNDAIELGVRFIACDKSMEILGISTEDLIDGVKVGAIGTYINHAKDSDINLFI